MLSSSLPTMASTVIGKEQIPVQGMNEEHQALLRDERDGGTLNEAEDVANPMDYTIVEEEDDSFAADSAGTQDLQVTLESALELRKNLESKFDEEIGSTEQPTGSIREKIAHFEKKAAQNQTKVAEENSKPPAMIVATTKDTSTMDRLKVYLRVRPCASKEASTIEILENPEGKSLPTTIRTYPPETSNAAKTDRHCNGDTQSIKEYGFTSVLGPNTSQNSVFEKTAAPLVNGLCRANTIGKSALLFCYGITNAGKTHTVVGDPRKQESWGIIPRCLATALQKVQHTELDVYLSSFEIYNEHIVDLLPSNNDKQHFFTSNRGSLKIREGSNGHMVIPGLAEYKVDSIKTGLSLIRRAKEARHTAPNHLNRASSRSHSVCQITVRRRVIKSEEKDVEQLSTVEEAHLWIVDLAGNERSKRTNAGSIRQKEATYINMSLMNLMRCLTSTQKPYRDSKLTLLFMHHWSNPENTTTMIVNVHGAPADYDETQHVLTYAISSKSIPFVASKAQLSKLTKEPEYGYDGRRKEKQLTMVQKAAKMVRKLSPKRIMSARKRKILAPFGEETQNMMTDGDTKPFAVKKARREQPTNIGTANRGVTQALPPVAHPNKQVSSLQMQLAVARAEIESLKNQNDPAETKAPLANQSSQQVAQLQMQLSAARVEIKHLESKKRELEQHLESVEATVRSEVSEEMLQEMTDMRRRFDNTIGKLKESFVQNEANEDSDLLESKINELVEKVEECEEEMSRMNRVHRSELKELEDDHEAALASKDEEIAKLKKQLGEKSIEASSDEVAELKKQLAASQNEVEQLKRSKDELVENYEKLLAPDDEEGEEGEEDDNEDNDDDSDETNPTPVRKIVPVKTAPIPGQSTTRNDSIVPSLTPTRIEVQNQVKIQSSQHRKADRSSHSEKSKSARKPLVRLNSNQINEADAFDSDSSYGPDQWLKPKRPVNKDPKTGLFARPKGRAPSAAESWDAKKGAWRLSVANLNS